MKKFQIELNKLLTENAGEIVLSIDESSVFQEKTDIIDPICQLFDAWVELFKYDDAVIFLDEYEKKVEFKKKDGEFLILNQRGKKLASVDSEQFLLVIFLFLKKEIEQIYVSGVDSFRIKDAYYRILEIEPFVPELVNGNDSIMYRTYHSTSDRYELNWKYLKGIEVEPIFTPVLSHDEKSIFYVEENNHEIRKLCGETKEEIWKCHVPLVDDCNCMTLNGVAIIWQANRFEESIAKLYAISSSSGELLWDLEIEGHIIQDIKTTREELPRLLVITREGYNVLLELESGVKVWEKNVRVGGEMVQCHLSSDYYVLAGNSCDEDGEVDAYSNAAIAIQLLDASILWKQMIEDCYPNDPVALDNEHFICVAADLLQKWEYGKEECKLIFEKALDEVEYSYIVSKESKIVVTRTESGYEGVSTQIQCYDHKNGQKLYGVNVPSKIELIPFLIGEMMVLSLGEGRIYGVNIQTGKVIWNHTTLHDIVGILLYKHGEIYIATSNLELIILDAGCGEVKNIIKLPKNVVEIDFIVSIEEVNNRLFISCVSGNMFEIVES
ncbi:MULTISPECIES: PQQ-binding-like beta-propeller repeat protein [Bacillus cereus group]|uniref:outer membrane protein assembly factor BamB family protein n=1 Tax=Bacillus cereus group TaxID=86661 RepID=UPI0018F7C7CD|nr:PQQ-binding-like beta-propeller repeat protein [Bacillus cereus]MBJ8008780.1 PQQ-like beta-propeller repeat protein [Bacillus cereus]